MRLKAIIGNDAFWVPPRLWSYAAQNQPDGDFSDYQPGELGALMGWPDNASSMLQALQQSGFMDGMKIHDWDEHNEYHHKFSERAKRAAEVRWGLKEESTKEEMEKIRKEKKRPSIAQAMLKHASSITNGNGSYSKTFDEFWDEYPKKVGKGEAWKSWKKIHPDEVLTSKMVVAVRFQKECPQWKKDNGQYIPNPATWLNQHRWEDEVFKGAASESVHEINSKKEYTL